MSESAYPWNVLGIEETDDKKAIKKAYASLIKQYKPDEHPEKFQEIQEAYQEAKNLIQKKQSTRLKQSHKINNDNKNSVVTINSEEQADLAQSILQKIDLVAHENPNSFNINHWLFIKKFREIDDLVLKEETAQKAFKLVAEINLECIKNKIDLKIPMKIVKYMHKIFGWNHQLYTYMHIFPLDQIDFMYSQMDMDKPAYKIGLISFENRAQGLIGDIVFSMVISFFLLTFYELNFFNFFKYTFYVFTCSRFITEVLFRASFGKIGIHAYIVNSNHKQASIFRILIKHLIINMTFIPIFYWLSGNYYNYELIIFDEFVAYNIWFSIFCTMISLNIICLLFYKRFLHDVISQTFIIHKQDEEKPLFEH